MRLGGLVLVLIAAVIAMMLLSGCSTTKIVRTDLDGGKVTMTDSTFLVKRIQQDLSALSENDGSFITEWKIADTRGDNDTVGALATGFVAGMKAGALGAATGGIAP